jgi:hypothetical protein
MKRVLLTSAGKSAGLGVARSLRVAPEEVYLIGVDSDPFALECAEADEKVLTPHPGGPSYIATLKQIIRETGADLVLSHSPIETLAVSTLRGTLGAKTFLPAHETVMLCLDAFARRQAWEAAGLPTPRLLPLDDEHDLRRAFAELGPRLWLWPSPCEGDAPPLSVSDVAAARMWLELHQGWGAAAASEAMEQRWVAWHSIWKDGALLTAQGERRVSGASVSETVSDALMDKLAREAILAIDRRPHGTFSVELAYDQRGMPVVTGIRCDGPPAAAHFFTAAGFNFPYVAVRAAYSEIRYPMRDFVNPLAPGLVWVREMEREPVRP